ncbi:MAG: serine/threonine protein kinase [Myxococcota bacterium]|jgi:serine/threonine protein kinase
MSAARRFQLQEVVGRGGFGTVYRAHRLGDGTAETVALKILNPEVADQDFVSERLRDEARLLGLLRHRAIVKVEGLFRLDGRWTVVMEFIEGVNLKRLLTAGPVPVGCALAIIEQAASAFHYAYEMPAAHGKPLRLLHRDVKPANIHLTPDGEVKVLDFGVAWGDFQERESVTRSLMFGSLEYMSPERMDNIDAHAGDVYGLGAVLFELLVGEPLGRASGNRDRHNDLLRERLALLWGDYPDEELYRLVADCLAYDDARRPPARILERRVRSLRAKYPKPWLGAWAGEVVPPLLRTRRLPDDPLTGSILTETDPTLSTPTTTEQTPARSLALLLLGGGLAVAAIAMLAITSAGLWWWISATPLSPQPPPTEPAYIPELLPSIPAPEPVTPPEPVAPEPVPVPSAVPVASEVVEVVEDVGAVLVQGPVRGLQLKGEAGTFGPGRVPAGTYALSVSFDGEAFFDSGTVEVGAGQQVQLVCRENLRRCVAR